MHAARHGVFSRTGRILEPRANEIAGAIMELPHVGGLDAVGAEEIGALVALIEACDQELAKTLVGRGSKDKLGLLKVRLGASSRLERWCRQYGLTPKARAEMASVIATGESIADTLRRRREAA
jgi:hypothetical protein